MTNPKTPWLDECCFVLLDLETTGLDPKTCQILECAALGVDLKTLTVFSSFEATVGLDPKDYAALSRANPYVYEMHTKSGLLAECLKCPDVDTEQELDHALCSFLPPDKKIVLVGNSIGFDASFIRARLPNLAARLHYRVVDCSSFETCREAWSGSERPKEPVHRAKADCLASLQILIDFKGLTSL